MDYRPAKTVHDCIWLCDPREPLQCGDPRWQDFSTVRGGALDRRILRLVQSLESGGRFAQIALAGHRGCGKSTELYRMKERAEAAGYAVFYCRVNEELDPYDLDWPDLLLLATRMVEEGCRGAGVELPSGLLDPIAGWFKTITRIEDYEVNATAGVEAEIEAKAGIPWFGKLMLALTSRIQGGQTGKTEIREQVRHFPKVLLENVNRIVAEACRLLEAKGKKGILLIFDNVDRYRPEMADRLLLKSAEILQGIDCHCIYTVPVALIYDPLGDAVGQRYHQEVLPMVKVRGRDGLECEEGVEKLLEALNKRVDASAVFEDTELARELVMLSGGCMRDLLKLTQEACLNANDRINRATMKGAVDVVRSEISRGLHRGDYAHLARIHLGKELPGEEDHRRLLYHRYVLEYNGDRWVDVHPLIQGLKEFQDGLAAAREE